MTITEFFTFLAGAGGASAAAALIAERLSVFQNLDAGQKSVVMLGLSLLIALAAYAILTYVPQAELQRLAPLFQIIYGVAGTWLAGQIAHRADPGAKQ